jgi:hypothetical protein
MNYLITFPEKYTVSFINIYTKDTKKLLREITYLVGRHDIMNETDILSYIELILSGKEEIVYEEIENDYRVKITKDTTEVINGNFDDEENHTDIIPTADLRDLLREIIKIKKARLQHTHDIYTNKK